MVNRHNFLHTFVITVPSSITKELEKNLLCYTSGRAHKEGLFLLGTHLGQSKITTQKRAEGIFSMVPIVQEGEFSRRKSTEAIASLIR